MNKITLVSALFSLPIWLFAQATENMNTADLSASPTTNETATDSVALDEPMVVEIPETTIDGASFDVDESLIPEVSASLPSSAEVILDMPDASSGEGSAVMGEEETISVDFPDEDVRTILRNVADLFDLNLVIPDTLQGRTSLKLRNITWRQVFEVVLDPLGFTYVEDRNIIRIKSVDALSTEPVDTRVFVINYSQADQIRGTIAPLVDAAAGGRIQVDVRSNSLVITERPSRMNQIQEIIERLDRATDQVMIESKFVEIRRSGGRDLGLDWSSLGADGGVGLQVGDFANRLSGNGGTVDVQAQNALSGFGVPRAAVGTLTNNPFDTAVFSAESFTSILRALNSSNNVNLVSNPTVVTMDNEKAEIKITREFPQPDFTFNAETGQRQFNGLGDPIDVGITLEVTPTVNAAGFINLDIFPEVSSTSEDRIIEGTAFPIRDVRTAKTRIMIKDGFTLALGGLVSKSDSKGQSRIPILGDIPGLGRLFRSDTETTEETNLVIFITAKTLNPDGTDYRDIVDPRLIERMEITPSSVPGYITPDNELERIQKIQEYRAEAERLETLNRLDATISTVEAANQKEANPEQNNKGLLNKLFD